jgi:hypothetical protein
MQTHKVWITISYLLIFVAALVGGYGPPRSNYYLHLFFYSLGFAGVLLRYNCRPRAISFKEYMVMGLMLRLILLPIFPPIFSDDIYRFLWDGWLINQGIDPYQYTPRQLFDTNMVNHPHAIDLMDKMNSPDYYSVYPPTSQIIFSFCTWLFPGGNILSTSILLRGILILCEGGLLYLMWNLASILNQPKIKLIWYSLNPLVILEVTGNLHFEGIVALGLATSSFIVLKSLEKKNQTTPISIVTSAFTFAMSIGTKLTPILIIPALTFKLLSKHYIKWLGLLFTFCFILFIPIIISLSNSGFLQSIDLYFRKFEFNASLYYLLRWIGIEATAYNQIAIIGPLLALASTISLLIISWLGRHKLTLTETGLLLYTSYYLMSTTVHPWYIIVPLFLGVFTNFKYITLWSYTIFFSYSAYQSKEVSENTYWLIAEYLPVIIILIIEIRNRYTFKKAS